MIIPHWKNPNRKRLIQISYTDKDYCKYYDLDQSDLNYIIDKLRTGKLLTQQENDRYGIYILTICNIVRDNIKFKNKPINEVEEMYDVATLELLQALPKFDKSRGSSIYSFAYRCCYVAFIHYYEDKKQNYRKQQIIINHCNEELDEYLEEFDDHKVRNINKEN